MNLLSLLLENDDYLSVILSFLSLEDESLQCLRLTCKRLKNIVTPLILSIRKFEQFDIDSSINHEDVDDLFDCSFKEYDSKDMIVFEGSIEKLCIRRSRMLNLNDSMYFKIQKNSMGFSVRQIKENEVKRFVIYPQVYPSNRYVQYIDLDTIQNEPKWKTDKIIGCFVSVTCDEDFEDISDGENEDIEQETIYYDDEDGNCRILYDFRGKRFSVERHSLRKHKASFKRKRKDNLFFNDQCKKQRV